MVAISSCLAASCNASIQDGVTSFTLYHPHMSVSKKRSHLLTFRYRQYGSLPLVTAGFLLFLEQFWGNLRLSSSRQCLQYWFMSCQLH